MRHSRPRACGSCQSCGRQERAHSSLQNRRRFRTAPTRLIIVSLKKNDDNHTPQNCWSSTHRFCGGGPKGNFQFERVIVGWRARPMLDLRRK